MVVHYYKNAKAAAAHKETIEMADWLDGYASGKRNEVTFRRSSDGLEITIPFSDFICVVPLRFRKANRHGRYNGHKGLSLRNKRWKIGNRHLFPEAFKLPILKKHF